MNRNDIIDVLTAVAAADRRTVGEADVTVWCAVISDETRVTKPEALQAIVEHFRERPGVWLEPGHIVERVRLTKRDQMARESDEMRERRQAELDARVAEEVWEIAMRKQIPAARDRPAPPPARPSPLTIPCTWCHAGVGEHCTVPQTNRRPDGGAHPSRIEAAEAKTDA